MILVLAQSESPWQRNDAITFFIYLCVSVYQEFFGEIALGSMYLPQLPQFRPKFEQIL